jgi:uncharacterized integral membrane protein
MGRTPMTYAQFALGVGIFAIFVIGIIIGSTFGYGNGVRDANAKHEAERLAQTNYQPGTIVGTRTYAREMER